MSIDIEPKVYQYAKEQLGITMITCSHRPGLKKYHKKVLRIGDKKAIFGDLTKEELDKDNGRLVKLEQGEEIEEEPDLAAIEVRETSLERLR